MRYFLHIAYNGVPFRGWQKQQGVVSVQDSIEKALLLVCKEKVVVVGCGRTDAQVHASQFILHFDLKQEWQKIFVDRLNQSLPKEVVVYDAFLVAETAHARFDAIERTYEYYIHTKKDPFLKERSLLYQHKPLDIGRMQMAVQLLNQYNDYLSFCKTPSHNRTTLCAIFNASIKCNNRGDRIVFSISANRFLRGMIRSIVQKLLEVGSNDLSLERFERLLAKPEKPQIEALAAPYGLYLSKIVYPYFSEDSLAFRPTI